MIIMSTNGILYTKNSNNNSSSSSSKNKKSIESQCEHDDNNDNNNSSSKNNTKHQHNTAFGGILQEAESVSLDVLERHQDPQQSPNHASVNNSVRTIAASTTRGNTTHHSLVLWRRTRRGMIKKKEQKTVDVGKDASNNNDNHGEEEDVGDERSHHTSSTTAAAAAAAGSHPYHDVDSRYSFVGCFRRGGPAGNGTTTSTTASNGIARMPPRTSSISRQEQRFWRRGRRGGASQNILLLVFVPLVVLLAFWTPLLLQIGHQNKEQQQLQVYDPSYDFLSYYTYYYSWILQPYRQQQHDHHSRHHVQPNSSIIMDLTSANTASATRASSSTMTSSSPLTPPNVLLGQQQQQQQQKQHHVHNNPFHHHHSYNNNNQVQISIFYNIYIAPIDSNPYTVIREQINAIGTSYIAQWYYNQSQQQQQQQQRQKQQEPSSSSSYGTFNTTKSHNDILYGLTLYYNTIGNHRNWDDQHMNQNICLKQKYPIQCIHLNHYKDGYEEVTLQSLYEYCYSTSHDHHPYNNDSTVHDQQQPKGQHHRSYVIYIHNKGSFPKKIKESYNPIWRTHLIDAVTSKECWMNVLLQQQGQQQQQNHSSLSSSYKQQQQCSICTLQFLPMYAMMTAGNFWLANCNYIRSLVPPKQYIEQVEIIFQNRPSKQYLNNYMYSADQRLIGRFRYANEEWIASHPSIVPCDLSISNNVQHWWINPHVKPDISNLKKNTKQEKLPVLDNSTMNATIATNIVLSPNHPVDDTAKKSNEDEDDSNTIVDMALYEYKFDYGGIRHNYSYPIHPWFILDPFLQEQNNHNLAQRIRNQHILPGIIYKWHQLYPGQFPKNNSWIWTFYPDGLYWQKKIQQAKYNGWIALQLAWNETPLVVVQSSKNHKQDTSTNTNGSTSSSIQFNTNDDDNDRQQ